MHKCELCGEEFAGLMAHVAKIHKMGQYEYAKKFNVDGYFGVCKFCGKEFEITRGHRSKHKRNPLVPPNCGQKECARKAQYESCEKKYGNKYPMKNSQIRQRWEQIQMEKWGGLSWLCNEEKRNEYYNKNLRELGHKAPLNSKESRQKGKETCVEKYGVDNPLSSVMWRAKGLTTLKRKYNINHPFERSEFLEKSRQTCMRKFGATNAMKNEIIKQKVMNNQNFKPEFNRSKIENEFKKILDNMEIRYYTKKICENFVDFCIELEDNNRLIIMVDGEYWHNLKNKNIHKKALDTIYEAKGDRDFGRLAKQMKDGLFNSDCEKDRSITLLRFKTGDIKKYLGGDILGFYRACGDVSIIDSFMTKINLGHLNNN
jgi:hypothetical protein